jgi:dephospho-CoA kinase
MRVGLTGGIGSGKSEVAKDLALFGALVIDTDELARRAVEPGSEGLASVQRLWPQVVRDGGLDRAALAAIVFGDAAARERLNAIVHPLVRSLAREAEARALPGQLVVHVVPLLFETDYAELVDATVLVIAPDEERIARVVARDRAEAAQVRARMAAQIEPDEARELADYVIENDGDLATLRARTRELYDRLASAQ